MKKTAKTLFLLLLLVLPLQAENWMKRLPDDAYVENVHLSDSLMQLTYRLKHK